MMDLIAAYDGLPLLAAFAVAQILDVITTLAGMAGGAREVNPLLKWVMDRVGKGWVLLKLGTSAPIAGYLWTSGQFGILAVVTAATLAVALNNLRFIK